MRIFCAAEFINNHNTVPLMPIKQDVKLIIFRLYKVKIDIDLSVFPKFLRIKFFVGYFLISRMLTFLLLLSVLFSH